MHSFRKTSRRLENTRTCFRCICNQLLRRFDSLTVIKSAHKGQLEHKLIELDLKMLLKHLILIIYRPATYIIFHIIPRSLLTNAEHTLSSTTIQQKLLRHRIHHTIAYMPLFHCKFYIGGNTPGTENHYNTLSIQPSKVQRLSNKYIPLLASKMKYLMPMTEIHRLSVSLVNTSQSTLSNSDLLHQPTIFYQSYKHCMSRTPFPDSLSSTIILTNAGNVKTIHENTHRFLQFPITSIIWLEPQVHMWRDGVSVV